MNIVLLGYGKMGRAIEEIAVSRGHTIVCKVGIENLEDRTVENIKKGDVAIEFSSPDSAYENVKLCVDNGVPVVCGSTGWLDKYAEIKKLCEERKGKFLYASNFSVGVNIFFALNKKLAELMAPHKEYEVDLKEIHHTQKLDAPSGTAITLAQQVLNSIKQKKKWVNQPSDREDELVITSERTDPAPGTHIVNYHSDIDDICITHTAHSRKGFASGAVLAAEFLAKSQPGVYEMNDVLGIE
ncbi:MAG: 4-hydroxy-tetrahydrodipicolinate reductase [Chitinophagaceae bacterium]|nr:4-hydroxy-tetrahydrodipicolinate reductase [Chitinophagaceae bacterium]